MLTQDLGGANFASALPTSNRSLWIGGPRQDLVLLVATPLLIVPLISLARGVWSDMSIVLFVATFGAIGHHAPGLLRAYGDPSLVGRYRTRLIVAPIALVTVCLSFGYLNLNGLVLMTVLWGLWHGLAQVYGLGRMYDAKVGMMSPRTSRLDKALCIGWFGGGFLISESRFGIMLEELYKCGVPAISPEAIYALRFAWMAGTLLVTALWAWNQIQAARAGAPGNPIKLLLFGSSFLFWWYAQVRIENAILGVALFELFHDVQYLATVWIYNRKLVSKKARLGRALQFMFRPKGFCVALYLGVCVLYAFVFSGGYTFFGEENRAIRALLLTSGFLHFYFDSFIWNVREKSIRDDLDFRAQGPAPIEVTRPARFRAIPGAGWAYFVIPLVLLAWTQSRHAASEVEWTRSVVESRPTRPTALLALANALHEAGRSKDALEPTYAAAALDPDSLRAQEQLLLLAAVLGLEPEARAAFQRIVELGGEDAPSHVRLGMAVHRGTATEAAEHYSRALELDPNSFEAHTNLASFLASQGDPQSARGHLAQAARIEPSNPNALYNLAKIEGRLGNIGPAVKTYRAVLAIQPDHARARRSLKAIQDKRDLPAR